MDKKMYKDMSNKMFFGVCSGMAKYFNMDANIVRLIFVLLCAPGGIGLILYIVAAIILPEEM